MPQNKKQRKPKISVIVPTYNEQETVGSIIRRIKKFKDRYVLEIIVSDGGSKDNTVQLAKEEKVKVIQNEGKRGKGIDFWEAARKATGDYIVQIDGDDQFSPEEIPLFIEVLEKGADIAIAHRVDQSVAPLIRTFGNWAQSLITSILIQKRIHDTFAGFKATKRSVLMDLDLKDHHFGYEAEIVIKGVRKGYHLVQIPVSYRMRETGISQVSLLKTGFLNLTSMIKYSLIKLPQRRI